MTRRVAPKPGVDRMVSPSWTGRRRSSPAARQGRALARGLEGRLPLQHHHASDQNSSSSRCRASFSLALKHGIYRASPRDFLTVAQGGPRGFRQWARNQQNSSTGYCLDGARQARAVDLLIDPPHAVIDSSRQSLVRILISAHGFSGLITSSPLIDIFTISFASRSIFKRSSMRIWLLS
jgi:hypothetical protein